MNRGTKGIVIFAVAYFMLFVALEWYMNSVFAPNTAFYESPVFAMAVIVYAAVVAAMLLRYRNKNRQ
ncbi:MAG: hypothetical protein QW194_04720 [Candidatus Micrarchaeaceae archaeon]